MVCREYNIGSSVFVVDSSTDGNVTQFMQCSYMGVGDKRGEETVRCVAIIHPFVRF